MTNREKFLRGIQFQHGFGDLYFKFVDNDRGGRIEFIERTSVTGTVYHCSVLTIRKETIQVYIHIMGVPTYRTIKFSDMKFC